MTVVIFRTAIIYLFLVVTVRLLGKRQLGELDISELVVTLMVSEMAVSPITNDKMPLLRGILPVVVLIGIEGAVSRLILKSPRFKKIFGGTPSILIRSGKIMHRELTRSRISIDELMASLRQAGCASVCDAEYAILEANGKLSVIPKSSNSPANREEIKIEVPERGIDHGIIIDGYINDRSLDQAGKTRDWLENILRCEKITAEEVLLLTVNDADEVNIQKKEKTDDAN